MSKPSRISTGTFFGLLLILLGVLWVLQNTSVIDFHIRVWWPLILIVIGLLHLYHHRKIFDFAGSAESVNWVEYGAKAAGVEKNNFK
jgi:hypothetical protein